MNKKALAIFIGLGLLLTVVLLLATTSPAPQKERGTAVDLRGTPEVSIVLEENGFVPRDIIISPGTIVTFSTTRTKQFWPASNTHPSHNIFPAFDPKRPLDPSESWSFTFEREGNWGYHDHVRSYFTGIIYVESE